MPAHENTPQKAKCHLSILPAIQDSSKPKMEVKIGNDIFIINHAYTGTHTIEEVYEDFLKRVITNR